MQLTDELIDKRLEFLYQRMESSRKHYYNHDQKTAREWECDLRAYNQAVSAHGEACRHYNRSSPSIRAYMQQVHRILYGSKEAIS